MILPALLLAPAPRTVVLTYHDVIAKRGAGSVWFDCTASEFRSQMAWLKGKGARFASVAELEASLSGGKALPSKAVVVTFADNYRGFFTYALPVLKSMRIPAAMFVHTGFVGSPVGRPKMTWDQLKTCAGTGLVTVASQTVSHPADLAALSDAMIRKEFGASKAAVVSRFGACRYLAYPNGKYDMRVARLARAAGYAMAFTEVTKPAETRPDLWRVPRYVHTKYRQAWRDANR